MKLTPIWQELVSSPFEKRNCILTSSLLDANYSEKQSELITYLVKSGVNDSNNRVKEFLDGSLRVGPFGKVECKFPIDWQADPHSNRTWQWLHHQLAILGDFSCLIASGQHNYLVETACLIIDDWSEHNFVEELPSEFSWGDHSTAHRLKNLVNFLVVAQPLLSLRKIESYLKLIDVHCKVLSTAKFFNKHTNHGIDQVLYLLLASCYFPQLKSANRYRKIAVKRLEGEIDYGFAADGVHVENSPQYHFILLNRLAVLNTLIVLFELDSNIDLRELFSKAIKFAGYIKRPDTLIPIIGDSEQKKAFLSPLFNTMKEYKDFHDDDGLDTVESHLFKESGYYMYRKKLTENRADDLHLIVKCGYLSNYHRQDDDGSFVLMAYSEDWFVDGGLYKHDNSDEIRKYLRSVSSHNTIKIEDAEIIRNIKKIERKSSIKLLKSGTEEISIKANVEMYSDYTVHREFIIHDNSSISVIDSVEVTHTPNAKNRNCKILFHIPTDKDIVIEDGNIKLSSQDSCKVLSLVYEPTSFTRVYIKEAGAYDSYTSNLVEKLTRVHTVVLETPLSGFKNKNKINLKFMN